MPRSGSVDIVDPPQVLFTTRTNTELGAASVRVEAGELIFRGVAKQVTEGMLTSYPRTLLGEWTPNRAALRYPVEEFAQRRVKRFETGQELDLDEIRALED